ncbi:MAG: kynureninase [Alphaproteobacteria bacterium]|jgi:kynureninase|nr:kynureninase [Alphaproteobacteria bacterium]MDP6816528.1 kynureninase [Alphaproteobacteria bacterium]
MTTREDCAALDARDPLANFRARFALPEGVIYLDGNSLGALPLAAAERARDVIGEEWGDGLIRSWNEAGWMDLPFKVGARIAVLIGAEAGEVVACDSTSVNLFKLLAAALALRPKRHVVVTDSDNFPTDNYIAEGIGEFLGPRVERRLASADEIIDAIDGDTAVVSLTHVDYRTGRIHDMAAISAAAAARGALSLWDLSHSAGALALDLNGSGADLAVGCGYKYLNGGPGAPAYLFVAERHHAAIRQPLSGWMGHAAPFDFSPRFRPAPGIQRMLSGTPPVIALALLECGLDILSEAGMAALRAKSVALGELFMARIEARCAGHGLELLSPRDSAQRGSQVSYAYENGYGAVQALIARGVIGDFRQPDVMRFGLAPLYLRHVDVWDAAEALGEVLDGEEWRRHAYGEKGAVT